MPCPQREIVVSSYCTHGSDAENLLRLVEQHQISHLHMVPTMFARLLRPPDEVKRRYDLSSLQFVVHAAASVRPC